MGLALFIFAAATAASTQGFVMHTIVLQGQVLELLVEIAPAFTVDNIDIESDLREQLDIDSMDIHQLASRIYETFGVDVPEAERAELTTVRRCVAYLEAHGARVI